MKEFLTRVCEGDTERIGYIRCGFLNEILNSPYEVIRYVGTILGLVSEESSPLEYSLKEELKENLLRTARYYETDESFCKYKGFYKDINFTFVKRSNISKELFKSIILNRLKIDKGIPLGISSDIWDEDFDKFKCYLKELDLLGICYATYE